MFYDLTSSQLLGAQPGVNGTHFRVFTHWQANRVQVQIWRDQNRGTPWREVELESSNSPADTSGRTKDWAALVSDAEPGFHYTVRAWGPWSPDQGLRFNENAWLIDPAARAMGGQSTYHDCLLTGMPGDPLKKNILPNVNHAPLGVIIDPNTFDWAGDEPLKLRKETLDRELVIAEVHVRGATIFCKIIKVKNGEKEIEANGTYFAIGSTKFIKHLKKYGVTVVELMPVHQTFLDNGGYWKYNPTIFGAPEREYSASPFEPLEVVREFKIMVRNLHLEGILIIIDNVSNHTDEGNEKGLTLSLKGLDNHCYRLCGPEWLGGSKRHYQNWSGVGNALNTEHPGARRLILEMCRRWILEYHIDGFRWDLFGALSGGDSQNPFVLGLQVDPVLSECIHHFENYSAVDYHGHAINVPAGWSEWRGVFRDTVRPTILGQRGNFKHLADCLTGRRSVHEHPFASVATFATHDGFNFSQWLMHSTKSNWTDGHWPEHCYDCGFDGPSDDPEVIEKRMRLWKFAWTLIKFSPLSFFRFGDHILSYPGHKNNNPYAMGDDGFAVRWRNGNTEFAKFSKRISTLRKKHANLGAMIFDRWQSENDKNYPFGWHTIFGHKLSQKSDGWDSEHGSLLLPGDTGDLKQGESNSNLLVAINLLEHPLDGFLPGYCHKTRWEKVLDTGSNEPFHKSPVSDGWYTIEPSSIALLVQQ